jgi:hypothetical protein
MDPMDKPARWRGSEEAVKAVQVAFDVEAAVFEALRRAAFESNLSTSDQIRVVLGLPVIRQPKRPRLTLTLTAADYDALSSLFGIPAEDRLAIKEAVLVALRKFAEPSGPNISGNATSEKRI